MPKRTRIEIVAHKRGIMEHAENTHRARIITHGKTHLETLNAAYDLACKKADYANENWKLHQTNFAKNRTPENEALIRNAELAHDEANAEKERLEALYKKSKGK